MYPTLSYYFNPGQLSTQLLAGRVFGCFRLAPYHVIADRVRRGAPHHCLDDSLREYGPALSEPPYVPVDLGLSGMSWPAFGDMFHTPPQTGRLSSFSDE